jgi:Serine/threonine protein kinase
LICKTGKSVEIKPLALKLIEIIDFLHSNNIIHGNIKPTNVLFDNLNNIKLSDLGLGNITHSGSTIIEEDHSLGIFYESPEQLQDEIATISTDYFCLGSTLYFAICKKPPFIQRTTLQARIEFPEEINNYLSEGWKNLLLFLTEPDPLKRLSNPEEIKSQILQLEEPDIKKDIIFLTYTEKDETTGKERYKITSKINETDFGIVSSAVDTKFHRNVWLIQSNDSAFDLLCNKVKEWIGLRTQNLQKVFDIDIENRTICLSSPEGIDILNYNRPLSLKLSLKIVKFLFDSKCYTKFYSIDSLLKSIFINDEQFTITIPIFDEEKKEYDPLNLWYFLRKIKFPHYRALPFLIDEEFRTIFPERGIEQILSMGNISDYSAFSSMLSSIENYIDKREELLIGVELLNSYNALTSEQKRIIVEKWKRNIEEDFINQL